MKSKKIRNKTKQKVIPTQNRINEITSITTNKTIIKESYKTNLSTKFIDKHNFIERFFLQTRFLLSKNMQYS